jgi:hypothetical protein
VQAKVMILLSIIGLVFVASCVSMHSYKSVEAEARLVNTDRITRTRYAPYPIKRLCRFLR